MAVEGISARPYLDHNIDLNLAADLRRYGFDVMYAAEVGNERASDEEHLRWAEREHRVLITYDHSDFQVLAQEWAARGEVHAGIIISQAPPFLSYGTILRRLLVLLDTMSGEELINQVRWLDATWDRNA